MSRAESRLEALETKLAFQEDALQQLSDTLVAHQARMDRLEARLRVMTEQIDASGGDAADDSDHQPPPHY